MGDLTLAPHAEDLAAADGITEIRGNLGIVRLDGAEDLAPLKCLRRVWGNVSIFENENLRSLDGLERLEKVQGLSIGDNRLQSLAGLASLREASSISVLESELVSLDLPSLERVGEFALGICVGGTDVVPEIGTVGNPMLKTLGDLSSLQSVDYLRIEGNDALETIDSLRALGENSGSIGLTSIRHNASLPAENVHEVLELVGSSGSGCGNLGDDPDPFACSCGNIGA